MVYGVIFYVSFNAVKFIKPVMLLNPEMTIFLLSYWPFPESAILELGSFQQLQFETIPTLISLTSQVKCVHCCFQLDAEFS